MRPGSEQTISHPFWAFGAIGLLLMFACPASADPAHECDQAAREAAELTEVPLDILRTITRTETGRGKTLKPWPWTVNMEGRGVWFDTAGQAKAYVFRHFKQGARSFDVGCFQINYRWHGQAFSSIDEMFEPQANARYAARYLARLHREFGDWDRAVGAFHSRTHAHASRYLKRYAKVKRALPKNPLAPDPRHALVSRRTPGGNRGSLVPLRQNTGRGILPRLGG